MRILVATDFSPHAEDAVRLVRGMPLPSPSTLRLIHVIEPFPEVSAFAPAAITAMTEAAEAHLRAELDAVAETLRAPGRDVEAKILIGRTADVIVEQASAFGAELVVMGSRGRRAVASALLGSVSAEVVDRAPCPVLIARGVRLSRVVLAEDGSETAAAGAALIETIPALRFADVRVVSVLDAPFPSMLGAGDTAMGTYAAVQAYYDSLPSLREKMAAIAQARANALARSGINATFEMREGDAAAQLIEAAAASGTDCIVIGSHGRTGLSRFFMGSVARGVLFSAPCSVLVVRGPRVRSGAAKKEYATASV